MNIVRSRASWPYVSTLSTTSKSDLRIDDKTATANSKSGRIKVGYNSLSKIPPKHDILS